MGDRSAQLRFLREARAAATVRHQNVASVLHLGRAGQNYFYAMEFAEGETLEKRYMRFTFPGFNGGMPTSRLTTSEPEEPFFRLWFNSSKMDAGGHSWKWA